MSKATMTDEVTPSTPGIGETKPRFQGIEATTSEVGFKRERAEVPAVEPEVVAPSESEAAKPPEAALETGTAVVVVEPDVMKARILPHIEVDYSKYADWDGAFNKYPRVDPNINLRSAQEEAVDTYLSETDKRRVIISLPTGCVDGDAIIQVNRAGKGFKISLGQLYRRFNGIRPNKGPRWDLSIPTFVKALTGDSLRQHRIRGVLDKGEKEVVELTLASGKKLKLTPDHEVCVGFDEAGEQIYRRTDSLSPGDDVLTNGTPACATCRSTEDVVTKTDKVVSVKPAGKTRVFDIVCEDPWRNFVANSIVVHNCGKTVAGLSIAGRVNGRVLWIAHRDELIEQPAEEIKRLFPDLEFGIEKANTHNGIGKRVVISSIQTLSRKNRMTKLLQGAPFSVVIYDECHHAVSAQAMRVLSWLGCFRKDGKGPRLLGLTATIDRADKTSLGHVFDDVIYSLSIQEAQELGFLVPHKAVKVYLPMRLKKGADGDISMSDADREAHRLNISQANATNVKVHCGDRKTIVFTTSVDQAKRTAEACRKLGIKAEWVSGMPYMNKSTRKAVLKRFSDGEVQVAVCAELLTEGYDDKTISAVVIARPTLSESRWMQMAGRGLRTSPHKTDCLLIDIACSGFDLVTADILLKKPETKLKKKPRKRTEVPTDSNTEWTRLLSYLRSARIDTIEHGEIIFARCSDDLIVTVSKDSKLVILRRTQQKEDGDLWVIEHGGIVYTLEPLALQEAIRVCDTLIPTFGGGAKPDSPEWEKATADPTPPPGIMPTGSSEPTQIVDPAAQLPLAMKFVTGSGPVDLAERVSNDIMNANSVTFARGLKLAFEKKKCHLLSIDKLMPADPHKWGWVVSETRTGLPPSVSDAKGAMIGWVYGDLVCVDPLLSVRLAKDALVEAGEKDVEIKTSLLRTHLGTVNRTFKDMRKDWIKVKARDIEPNDTGKDKES